MQAEERDLAAGWQDGVHVDVRVRLIEKRTKSDDSRRRGQR
jgi:hypothetical protein